MTDKDRAAFHEACAHLSIERNMTKHMEMLIARALSCSQQQRRPSESWEAEATALLRVIDQDRKEKSYV